MKYFKAEFNLTTKRFKRLVVNFGKFKGEPAESFVYNRLHYLDWCFNNLPQFKLTPSLKMTLFTSLKSKLIQALSENEDVEFYISFIDKNLDIIDKCTLLKLCISDNVTSDIESTLKKIIERLNLSALI